MTKKRTEEEVREIVESLGYTLISSYLHEKRKERRVVIRDSSGFTYDYHLSLLSENSKLRPIDNNNPYSISNIPIWLILNNKEFKLCEGNSYRGNKIKLSFVCLRDNCAETFLKKWNAIASGEGCPYCNGKIVGEKNSLLYVNPSILNEWNYDKNTISPSEITYGSNKHVWWICSKCQYEWKTSPKQKRKTGCPACAGKTATDKNGLFALYPELISEWNFKRNKNIDPYTLTYGSKTKVWWLCAKCEFEWETTPNKRSYRKDGCPNCSSSKGEKRIYNFLYNKDFKFEKEVKFKGCIYKEQSWFDFYISTLNLCIEYDGILHYKDVFGNQEEFKKIKKRDKIKTKYCKDNNINLLRIPCWEFDNIEEILEKTLSELR